MSIVLIVIYCLIAAVLIFGLTFHDELLNEKQRKQKAAPVSSIAPRKRRAATLRRRV